MLSSSLKRMESHATWMSVRKIFTFPTPTANPMRLVSGGGMFARESAMWMESARAFASESAKAFCASAAESNCVWRVSGDSFASLGMTAGAAGRSGAVGTSDGAFSAEEGDFP